MRMCHWSAACVAAVCLTAGARAEVSFEGAMGPFEPAPAQPAAQTGPVFAAAASNLTFREQAAPSAALQDEGAAPADDPEAWDVKWELGFSAAFGNTDTQSLQTALRGRKERVGIDRIQADAQYFYAVDNGDTSQNRFTAGGRYDYFIAESRWFIWGSARYDYDSFQSWRHRLGLHAGPGYDIVREDHLTITLLAGLGATYEWGSDDEGWTPEGILGADVRWKISERQDLVFASRFYPDLDDTGEFRWVNTAGWSMKLDEWDGVSLNVGVFDEYQSSVDPGREHNDFRIFGGVAIDF